MKKEFSKDAIVMSIGLTIASVILAQVAFELGGIELLLAGVVMAFFAEGAMSLKMPSKWYGLFYHLLCAGAFYCCYSNNQAMFDGWQWYFLWGLLAIRILVLQPIYLYRISKQTRI